MIKNIESKLFLGCLFFSHLSYGCDHHACEVKNGNISFTKDIELDAYKREYLDSAWKEGEEESVKNDTYPIFSIQMYNNEVHTWGYASEYVITSLKPSETFNHFLIEDAWNLRAPGGTDENLKRTLQKYYNKDVKYYIELNNNPNCNINNDLIIGVYKNGVKVENTHYKIKLMSPNEVKERLRFRNQ